MTVPTLYGYHRNGKGTGGTTLTQANGSNTGQIDLGSSGNVTILAWSIATGWSGSYPAIVTSAVSVGGQSLTAQGSDRVMDTEMSISGNCRSWQLVGCTLTGSQDYTVTQPDAWEQEIFFAVIAGGTAASRQVFTAVAKNISDTLSASISSDTNSMVISLGHMINYATTLTDISPSTSATPGLARTYKMWAMYRTGASGSTTVSATVAGANNVFMGETWTVTGSAASGTSGSSATYYNSLIGRN